MNFSEVETAPAGGEQEGPLCAEAKQEEEDQEASKLGKGGGASCWSEFLVSLQKSSGDALAIRISRLFGVSKGGRWGQCPEKTLS